MKIEDRLSNLTNFMKIGRDVSEEFIYKHRDKSTLYIILEAEGELQASVLAVRIDPYTN